MTRLCISCSFLLRASFVVSRIRPDLPANRASNAMGSLSGPPANGWERSLFNGRGDVGASHSSSSSLIFLDRELDKELVWVGWVQPLASD